MSSGGPPLLDPRLVPLGEWLQAQEGEHFEFKEAKNRFSFDELLRYACALANEGGGRVLLGITNKRPRQVVGSAAFPQIEDLRRSLMEKIPLRTDVFEIAHADGRVLVIEVPARPIGVPLKVAGVYWSRKGDSLVAMDEARLREIFAEAGHDFSSDVCAGAALSDLDPAGIEDFRRRWMKKSENAGLAALSPEQLLRDAELLTQPAGLTYAALILFGTRAALGRYLPQAEVIFEYRSSEAAGPAQQRKEYRQGFFTFYDDLWNTINLRNDLQHYQDGLFVFDIPTFAERSVREAALNAVSHRDYSLGGSVFVKQYARRLVVESPGGFPSGVTVDNVLDRQQPRNRRIAEAFARCGLVDRAGQGMNRMFEESIRQGKARPEFTGSDSFWVVVTLHGAVEDARFVQFLERVSRETGAAFGTQDYLVLDLVHRDQSVPPELHDRLQHLIDLTAIERVGHARGTRYLLSRRFYALIGRRGAYTRRRGLDRETQKALLERHLRETPEGSPLSELQQVLVDLTPRQVQGLLRDLREERRVVLEGSRRWGRWKIAKDARGGSGA